DMFFYLGVGGGLVVVTRYTSCMILGYVGMENAGFRRLNLKEFQVVERIIATPLIGSICVDKMVWEEEQNGCYSVKSGYKLAMKCIFRNDKYHVDDEVEYDVHIFFTCASAQSSWQAAGLSSVLGSTSCQQGSVADKVFALCRNEDYTTIVHKLRSNDDHDVSIVSTNRWEKPRIGWLKCNVNAAFFVSAGRWVLAFAIIMWQQLTLSTEEGET
ncbi:hypothetical protein L195_g029126, partial [Trifolium pratense]